MKSGWKTVPLESLGQVINGGTPNTKTSEYWDGTNLWITPAEMGKRQTPYLAESRRKLTDAGLKNSSASLVPPYSVILSTRAPIGHLVINARPMAFNQGCRAIVPNKDANYKYLFYFLLGNVGLLNDLGAGTTFKELSAKRLKSVHVSLPSLDEQKRIVAILDEAFTGIETAIANTKKNLANARGLFESYLDSIFVAHDDGWTEKKFGDVAEFKNGLNFTKRSKGDAIRIVGVKDFKSNFWVPMDQLETVRIDSQLSDSYKLRERDVLIVRSNGNKQLIGRSLLARSVDELTSHSGFTIRARVTSAELIPDFLVHFLKTNNVRESLVKSGGGANISSLNQESLRNLRIRFPSKNAQENIVNAINVVAGKCEFLERRFRQKLSALNELKQSLLQKAFSGELTANSRAAVDDVVQEAATA